MIFSGYFVDYNLISAISGAAVLRVLSKTPHGLPDSIKKREDGVACTIIFW